MSNLSVVSFCSQNYFDPKLIPLIKSWEKFCNDIHIYTDFDLPYQSNKVKIHNFFDQSFNNGTNYCRKAESLLDFMVCHDFHIVENILMLDMDCWLMRSPLCMFRDKLDITVTINDNIPRSKELNNVSAGVVVLRNRFDVYQFVKEWVRYQNQSNGPCRDQASLSFLINNTKLRVGVLKEKLFNSYPYTNSNGEIENWKNRIIKNKDELCVLHFAHGLWKDNDIVERVLSWAK